MFYRKIDENLKVGLTVPQFTDALFRLTDQNREFLKQWLPWLDTVLKPSDTLAFIELQLDRFGKGEAMHQSLFYQDRIAGVLGFNLIDQANGIGHLGYWLGEEFTGKGLMTTAVRDLIHQGLSNWQLQRIEIRCAVNNHKSRAIPERLGFKKEGTLRRAEKVYESYNDHVVYGLLKEEWL